MRHVGFDLAVAEIVKPPLAAGFHFRIPVNAYSTPRHQRSAGVDRGESVLADLKPRVDRRAQLARHASARRR